MTKNQALMTVLFLNVTNSHKKLKQKNKHNQQIKTRRLPKGKKTPFLIKYLASTRGCQHSTLKGMNDVQQ